MHMAAAKNSLNHLAKIDTRGWLTRQQAVDLLGVSMGTIVAWENRGLLTVERGPRGNSAREVVILNPDELARVPRKWRVPLPSEPGEFNARVFELLDQGRSLREMVVIMRETPAKILEAKEIWLDAGGSDLVIAGAAKVELERFAGPFSSVADLVVKLSAKLGAGTIVIEHEEDSKLAAATDAQIEGAIEAALDATTDAKPKGQ